MIKESGQFYQLAPIKNKAPSDRLVGTAQAIIGALYAHVQYNGAILHLARLDNDSVAQVCCCNIVGIPVLVEHRGQLDEMPAATILCAEDDQGILKPICVNITVKDRALITGGVDFW